MAFYVFHESDSIRDPRVLGGIAGLVLCAGIIRLAVAPCAPHLVRVALDGRDARACAECPLDARASLCRTLSLSPFGRLLLAGGLGRLPLSGAEPRPSRDPPEGSSCARL